MKAKTARRIVREFERIAITAGIKKVKVGLPLALAKTAANMSKHFGRVVTQDEVLDAIEVISTKKEKSQCR